MSLTNVTTHQRKTRQMKKQTAFIKIAEAHRILQDIPRDLHFAIEGARELLSNIADDLAGREGSLSGRDSLVDAVVRHSVPAKEYPTDLKITLPRDVVIRVCNGAFGAGLGDISYLQDACHIALKEMYNRK